MDVNVFEKEDALINALIKNNKKWEKKLKNLLSVHDRTKCDEFKNFLSKLDEKIKQESIENLLNNIQINWGNKNYEKLSNDLYSLTDSEIYFVDYTKKRFKPIIENLIKENNYFIDDLSGEIDYYQWNVALDIASFAHQYGFSKEFKEYIKGLKIKDRSSEYRYKKLLSDL